MKRVVSILVIAAFLAAPMLVAAQQAQPAAPSYKRGGTDVPAVESTAPAAPAKKAKTVTVTGMVDVVKDKKGKVTGYTLKTDTETYGLKGKSVKAMVGKQVEATGTVATAKGGKKVLTVKQVKEVM